MRELQGGHGLTTGFLSPGRLGDCGCIHRIEVRADDVNAVGRQFADLPRSSRWLLDLSMIAK